MAKKSIYIKTVLILLIITLIFTACSNTVTPNQSNNEYQEETTQEYMISSDYKVLATGLEDNGDYYELVGIQNKDTFDEGGIEIGVIKNNKWLVELSGDHPFINDSGYLYVASEGSYNMFSRKEFNLDSEYEQEEYYYNFNKYVYFMYCGNGCFMSYIYCYDYTPREDYYLIKAYNSETGKVFDFDLLKFDPVYEYGFIQYFSGDTHFGIRDCDEELPIHDYFIYDTTKTGVRCLDLNNMNDLKIQLGENGSSVYCFGMYSEGLFYAETSDDECNSGFFDLEGNQVIDLSKYPDLSQNRRRSLLYFENGECTFEAKDKGKNSYTIVIDKEGNVLSETAN